MRRDIGQYKKMQDDGEYVIDECQKLWGKTKKSYKVGTRSEPSGVWPWNQNTDTMDLNEREEAATVRRYMRIPDVKRWSAGVSE